MKAIRFNAAVPRYAVGMALGKLFPGILWSGLSCTYADDIAEPPLPTEAWVRIKTRYGGICGTDLGSIHLHTSPYYSPFSSSPFTLGHENTGTIAEVGSEVKGWEVGERVVVEPLLWCRPRGFEKLCSHCERGLINLCERFTEGDVSPGVMTGFCRDTGGSWSPYFVAHQSQLYRVPDHVSDENALMLEPFSVALHAALMESPDDGETVLIQGAGTIGLATLAALRVLGSQARIIVLARYPFQKEAAEKLGASEVIQTKGSDTYQAVVDRTGGKLYQPIIGKRVVSGGADRTFECVGSDASIDNALRLTRSGGRVVLVGVPGIAKDVDWSPIMAQELTIRASNIYHNAETYKGKTWETFELAAHLLESGKVDLGWMLTHRFKLDEYAQALSQLDQKSKEGIIKAAFAFE